MNYIAIGCAVTSLTYACLCYLLYKGKTIQNFTTWLLWALLDIVIAASVIYQGGNWPFIITYVLGCIAVAVTVYKKSSVIQWTGYETFVTVLAIVCMLVWSVSGARTATIAGTVAVIIAGIPQFDDIWRKPEENSILVYTGFLIGNIFSTAAGKDWSVEERFYPATCTVFCLIFILVLARRFFRKPR